MQKSVASTKKPKAMQPNILVVGDWVVDEHWMTGLHRTSKGSRTGEVYSRVLNDPSSNMTSLCGAGLVASIFHSLQRSEDSLLKTIRVYGLGVWHPDDTAILENMLDPSSSNGFTHHKMSTDAVVSVGPRLYSLTSFANQKQHASADLRDVVGTTRVIRIYERSHSRPRITRRIDWNVPLTTDISRLLSECVEPAVSQLPDGITHIVVKDLGKGVVTPKLIQELRVRYPGVTNWWVSSKLWQPDWLADLEDVLSVYIIPQVAARSAAADSKTDLENWLTTSGVPSKEALSYVAANLSKAKVVVLADSSRILARDTNGQGYVQTASLPAGETGLTQMASVFLPSLLTYQIEGKSFGESLALSLAYTEKWRQQDQGRLLDDKWKHPQHHLDLGADHRPDGATWIRFNWGQADELWKQAFQNKGIITNKEKCEFHLWRGMTELPGYVATVPEKRKHIQQLIRDGKRFVERAERKHLSYVLVDKPGSGKSFLIDKLASELDMRPLKFNLTQLSGHRDLLHCFDLIRSEQERSADRPLLVFFDELNATHSGGTFYYGNFLEPMDDGLYVADGLAHKLQACFWIFAGTEAPDEGDKSAKGRDFNSRLARRPMYLNGVSTDAALKNVENTYIGVAAIRSVFQDVTEISEDILWIFGHLNADVGACDITRIVRNFENVQYGQVGIAQVQHDVTPYVTNMADILSMRKKPSEKMVVIVDDPHSWARET